MQTVKAGLSRLGGWAGRHKKLLIALAILVVLAGGLAVWKLRARLPPPARPSNTCAP